jgi:hypothetical protein
LSFDIAQPAQLLEKLLKEANSGVVDASDRTCGNDRNPVLLCRLLCPCDPDRGREQQTDREIAPPHIAAPAH